MPPCEQAQYKTTPQMAPRKTPRADMAMMVIRMGSSVFNMLPAPLIWLVSTKSGYSVISSTERRKQSQGLRSFSVITRSKCFLKTRSDLQISFSLSSGSIGSVGASGSINKNSSLIQRSNKLLHSLSSGQSSRIGIEILYAHLHSLIYWDHREL